MLTGLLFILIGLLVGYAIRKAIAQPAAPTRSQRQRHTPGWHNPNDRRSN